VRQQNTLFHGVCSTAVVPDSCAAVQVSDSSKCSSPAIAIAAVDKILRLALLC
jgi:hypothetical protein